MSFHIYTKFRNLAPFYPLKSMSVVNDSGVYVKLYHGRFNPSEEMSDWGFDGPIIGPVKVSWTYGEIRLIEPTHNDGDLRLPLDPDYEDLIHFDGVYYGDFCILQAHDVRRHFMGDSAPILDWYEFKRFREPL